MSQEASTHLISLEPSEDLIASEAWSVETYADGLMDELFADIDNILDHRHISVTRSSHAANSAYQWHPEQYNTTILETSSKYWDVTSEFPEGVLLQKMGPQIILPETVSRAVKTVDKVKNKHLGTLFETPAVAKRVVRSRRWRHTLGKMLSAGASLSFVIVAIIWFVNSGVLNRLISQSLQLSVRSPQPNLPTRSELDADLVDYMLGALSAIDRHEASNQKLPHLVSNLTPTNQTAYAYQSYRLPGNLPSHEAAHNTLPAPNRSTSVVERIYIPVYQAPQPMRYSPPPMSGVFGSLPPVTLPPHQQKVAPIKTAVNTPKLPLPTNATKLTAVPPKLKPVAIHTAPITVKQPPKPLPISSPVASREPSTEPSPPSAKPEMVTVATVPASSQMLEGLLELGSKSAALFKIDGMTRRVDIGESIGASGWTLVEISKGEAVIRRNGEVRSIYAGQNF